MLGGSAIDGRVSEALVTRCRRRTLAFGGAASAASAAVRLGLLQQVPDPDTPRTHREEARDVYGVRGGVTFTVTRTTGVLACPTGSKGG